MSLLLHPDGRLFACFTEEAARAVRALAPAGGPEVEELAPGAVAPVPAADLMFLQERALNLWFANAPALAKFPGVRVLENSELYCLVGRAGAAQAGAAQAGAARLAEYRAANPPPVTLGAALSLYCSSGRAVASVEAGDLPGFPRGAGDPPPGVVLLEGDESFAEKSGGPPSSPK